MLFSIAMLNYHRVAEVLEYYVHLRINTCHSYFVSHATMIADLYQSELLCGDTEQFHEVSCRYNILVRTQVPWNKDIHWDYTESHHGSFKELQVLGRRNGPIYIYIILHIYIYIFAYIWSIRWLYVPHLFCSVWMVSLLSRCPSNMVADVSGRSWLPGSVGY